MTHSFGVFFSSKRHQTNPNIVASMSLDVAGGSRPGTAVGTARPPLVYHRLVSFLFRPAGRRDPLADAKGWRLPCGFVWALRRPWLIGLSRARPDPRERLAPGRLGHLVEAAQQERSSAE